MKGLPYFKWYAADAETDERYRSMSDTELGFYHRCLNLSWMNGGLPADPRTRAAVLGKPQAYCDKQWKVVGQCFELAGDRYLNPRQERERDEAVTERGHARDRQRVSRSRHSNVTRDNHVTSQQSNAVRAFGSVSDSESENKKLNSLPDLPELDVEARFLALRDCHPGAKTRVGYCRAAYRNLVAMAPDPHETADCIDKTHAAWLEYWRAVKTIPLGLFNYLTSGDCMTGPPELTEEQRENARWA